MPNIDWLIHNSGLNNLRLLTGISHTDTEIGSVNILDNPDVLKWLKSGELILTTGYILKDNPQLQRSIIRDLKEIGCAALGIKIRRFFRTIPEAMLDEARRLDFPIIELPFFYGFSEISQKIFQQIYQENQTAAQLEQDFIAQFMNDILHREQLPSLLQKLADYLALPVLILDINYKPLTLAPNSTIILPQDIFNIIQSNSSNFNQKTIPSIITAQQNYFLQVLPLTNNTGYLCLIHQHDDFSDLPDSFLQKILPLAALAFEQSSLSGISYENRSSFFLHSLLHEGDSTIETQNLCTFYGFNYTKAWICLTFSLQDTAAENKAALQQTLRNLIYQTIPDDALPFLCTSDNLLCCFYLFAPNCHRLQAVHAVQKTANKLTERLIALTTSSIAMGISSCHTGISNIRQAFHESLQALNLHQLQKNESASYLHQLPHHLLTAYGQNTGKLLELNLLKPLLDFDRMYNTELKQTLQIYFDCNYNATAAAKELYLHRNTMTKRLEKIRELLDVDFTDAQENFIIYLSLLSLNREA